ncbi:MAG: ATP cone domain-containing protein, partial [Sulfurimonadaceae bacterium]
MITILKRNGRREPLDISKIQKYTAAAVKGLAGVSQSELEVDAQLHFQDGITSKAIQETLIKTAVDKIDIDAPNWTFVASRLFLFDLYHQVNGFTGYCSLEKYFERGEKEGRILLGLRDMYDLEELDKHIVAERDMLFNYLGVKTLY